MLRPPERRASPVWSRPSRLASARCRRCGRPPVRAGWRPRGRNRARLATRSAKTVNPPETSAVIAPPATASSRPAAARPALTGCGSAASSRTRSSIPFSKPTAGLERRDEVDLAVHCAARDLRNLRPKPKEIRQLVQHFVLDDRRLHDRRQEGACADPRRGWTRTSVSRRRRSSDAQLVRSRAGSAPSNYESQASPEASQIGRASAPRRSRSPRRCERDPGRLAVTGDQGEDSAHRLHVLLRRSAAQQASGPRHCRPDGEREIGARARTGRQALAASSSMPTACSVYRDLRILTARPTRPPRSRATASALRLSRCGGARLRGAVARPRAQRDRRCDQLPAACRSWSAAPAYICERSKRASRRCRKFPSGSAKRRSMLHRALGGAAFRERLAQLDPAAAGRLVSGGQASAWSGLSRWCAPPECRSRIWQRRTDRPSAYRFATILLDAAARPDLCRVRCPLSSDARGGRSRRGRRRSPPGGSIADCRR